MARFEVEANGQRYEIEAPDADTAMRAFSSMQQGQGAQETQYNPLERFGQATQSALTGAAQGVTMGAYDEAASLLGAPVKGIENLVTGQDQINGLGDVLPFLGRSFMDAREGQQALVDQAYEQAPVAAIGGDVAGALLTGGGMAARGVSTFGEVARPTFMGMAGRGALEGGSAGFTGGFNTGEDGNQSLSARLRAGALQGGAGAVLGGVTGGVLGSAAGKAQVASIPSADDLASQAGALYTAARKSGVTATPQMSQGINKTIQDIAKAENIILPKSGAVDSSYPKVTGIINVMNEYAGETLDVGRLQAIRRRIQDAAKSADPGERRIGVMMLDEFDDFATSVSPELAEASDLYWKAKTGELIDTAIELAGTRSAQYSQSGMENALRTEFRALNRKIIKGQLKGINPELAEQIALVADGSPIQNFARQVGKFAVRGPVSGVIPTLAAAGGFGAGGPLGAALGAGAIAIPGEIGKRAAERISVKNADVASALARSGGALPSWQFSPVAGALVQGASNTASRILPNF